MTDSQKQTTGQCSDTNERYHFQNEPVTSVQTQNTTTLDEWPSGCSNPAECSAAKSCSYFGCLHAIDRRGKHASSLNWDWQSTPDLSKTAEFKDGLHCVYGTCQQNLKTFPPELCHPGCYFQGSANRIYSRGQSTMAQTITDHQAQLGRDVRTEAYGLVLRANGPVTREGFVQVRKADLDALKAALDAEVAWYERNEA